MEVGRRSLSSENDFRERRRRRKKRGALPLAMMLSFNDKDVHPNCPYASNPYHKCGLHCLHQIPSAKNFWDAVRSDGDREWENKSEKKGVNPKCPHASNPYHKCAEFCLEKLTEKRRDAGKDQPGMNLKEEKKEVFTAERRVKPACINASNPNHVCAEYCFLTVPKKDQPGHSMRLKGSKEGEKVLNTTEKSGFLPQCKHASNPNHKCTESCFQSVPERNVAEGEKPKGISNKTNKSSVHLNRNASSHNKVTEYCFEDTPKKEHLKGDMKPKKENEMDVTTQQGFSSECKNASNPHHVCVEYCFQSVPEREQHGQVIRLKSSKEGEKVMSNIESTAVKRKEESEIIVTVEQRVNLKYQNASNPSHACPEYCSESVPERDRHEQVIRLKSTKEGDQLLNNKQRTGFDPHCKHASKPHHECTEFCFKNTPDRNLAEGENSGVSMETDKYVHSIRKHASGPYNKVTEYYFENISEKEHPEGAIKPKEESEIVVIAEQGVNLECKSASNPDHVRAEYCFQSAPERELHGQKKPKGVSFQIDKSEKPKGVSFQIDKSGALSNRKHVSNPYHEVIEDCFDDDPEKEHPNGATKPKEERIVVTAKGVNLVCKYASNPNHQCTEYCFQNLPIKDQRGKAPMKSMGNKVFVPPERVNPQCKHTSNPSHVCAEYCFQNVPNGNHPERAMMKSKEEKKVVAFPQVVNFDCKYASNPYHVCADYCFEDVPERDPPRQTIKKLKEEEIVVLPSERRVRSDCKFASNPYHVCAEYCFQNALESEQHGQVTKLKSLKELKNLVSNKKITSGHPQCEYAANSYHQCTEYYYNKNIPGSKIPDGVMKTNERKKEKSYASRRDDNPKYKNALNSFHRFAEYCPEEISPKNEEEISPKNEAIQGSTATVEVKKRNSSKENKRNHPIVEKISLKEGTKDLKSANVVEMKNPKEPTEVPPLHIDASDLFHEWGKYCSQTKVAEDEIVKQEKKVGMGEFTTRNGKGNGFLIDYDSANMEKVQAGGAFPRSLPISLHFLLEFLLALLHCTRVIHSLVMSSEKCEELERIKHARQLDPRCKKVSDPYHNCSNYCFPGVGEETH